MKPITLPASAPNNYVFLDPGFRPSENSFSVLSLPASFIPSPRSCPHSIIRRQVSDFIRKLQWSAALSSSKPPNDRFGRIPSKRWPPRALVPLSILHVSKRISSATSSLLRSPHQCHPPNLSRDQEIELARLRSLSSTTIKPSDKGGRWVLVPTTSYISEARRQLDNLSFYEPLASPPNSSLKQRLHQLLTHLHNTGFISTKEFRYLLPPSIPRPRRFYLLPKLHKSSWPSPHMPPGRPIVTDIDSTSRKCSDLINHFLLPLCALQSSHLKDSGHLIALLRSLPAQDNALLFTMDVEALYTNIPIDEGIQAVAEAFRLSPANGRPDLTLLSFLKLILSSNTFAFNDSLWRQTRGVAMGNPFGGAFANIFMASWERKALLSYPLKPNLWLRYQDDILGIWLHGEPALEDFHAHLNRQHSNIKTTLDFGSSVNFLDLNIFLSDSQLHFSLFSKPTDTHLILPPSSYHPPHTFKGVVFSEILRFATHSSSRSSFDSSFRLISKVWHSQGYSRSLIRTTKARVLSYLNLDTSWSPGMFPCSNLQCSVCSFASFNSSFGDNFSRVRYPIHSRFSCQSQNVIYLITCSKCRLMYVGETSRRIKDRILEHILAIRTAPTSSTLAQHFTSTCQLSHFTFSCIDASHNPERRKFKESRWISLLRTTAPTGLNIVSSSAPRTTNLILPFSNCSTQLAGTIKRLCDKTPVRASFTTNRNLRETFS